MSKYYVRKEKMRRLEREFRRDLRWLKASGIGFDMVEPAFVGNDDRFRPGGEACAVCLVGAHVCRAGLKPPASCDTAYMPDLLAAAHDLRVSVDWLESLYQAYDRQRAEIASFPQAAKLSLRLQAYARSIGL